MESAIGSVVQYLANVILTTLLQLFVLMGPGLNSSVPHAPGSRGIGSTGNAGNRLESVLYIILLSGDDGA